MGGGVVACRLTGGGGNCLSKLSGLFPGRRIRREGRQLGQRRVAGKGRQLVPALSCQRDRRYTGYEHDSR